MADFTPIPTICELHHAGPTPSRRLLVVFSAANATNFTFFRNSQGLGLDRLHLRDPSGNAWYQQGLAPGETPQDIRARITAVMADYEETWMLGASMGGFAAVFFGAELGVARVLAIAPQIVVDNRFSRGPRRDVKVRTPDIADLVRGATDTRFTIAYGGFDMIDAYNLSRLCTGGPDDAGGAGWPGHVRLLCYEEQDHMLPIRLDEESGLETFFRSLLFEDRIPATAVRVREGFPLSPDQVAVLERYVARILVQDHAGARDALAAVLPQYPGWVALRFLHLESSLNAVRGAPVPGLLADARDLSDAYPGAIDFAFLVARAAETTEAFDIARRYLARVFHIRKAHPPGRRMLQRLDAISAPGQTADAERA